MTPEQLAATIRNVPDWPKPGIQFKDITTLLKQPEAFRFVVDELGRRFEDRPLTAIVGIESRGFMFGAALAYARNLAFIPVRKPGKLPSETFTQAYDLEYGSDEVQLHRDGLGDADHVLIVDDLLATGGTAGATRDLVLKSGAHVEGLAFLIELTGLNGRAKLGDSDVVSLLQWEF